MQQLITAFIDLVEQLQDLSKPVMIGGGLGLYLKQQDRERQHELKTLIDVDLWPQARTTEDIDMFLPTEIVVHAGDMQAVRDTLDGLGYQVKVHNFQFTKSVGHGEVGVDLLTGAKDEEARKQLNINGFRVRPKQKVPLHAYLTNEAICIDQDPLILSIEDPRPGEKKRSIKVHIPNAFTYLVMKLHAFRDRVESEQKEMGIHHALDAYRIVAMLTRQEYKMVTRLTRENRDTDAVQETASIIRQHFKDQNSLGVLRLREGSKKSGLELEQDAMSEFVSVLNEFAGIAEGKQ